MTRELIAPTLKYTSFTERYCGEKSEAANEVVFSDYKLLRTKHDAYEDFIGGVSSARYSGYDYEEAIENSKPVIEHMQSEIKALEDEIAKLKSKKETFEAALPNLKSAAITAAQEIDEYFGDNTYSSTYDVSKR